jgi:hypothetical protein
MNVVLFLGAGFSARFGLPTMDGFLYLVDRSDRINDAERQFVYELLKEARQANSFIQSSPTNLEDILSFAVMGDRLGIFDKSGQPRAGRVGVVLRKLFSAFPVDPTEFWDGPNLLLDFLGTETFVSSLNLTVITTNYDLLVDCSLHRMGRGISLGFRHAFETPVMDQVVDLYQQEGIRLFKLHGSVNWSPGKSPTEPPVIDGRLVKTRSKAGSKVRPVCSLASFGDTDVPLIVPPTFTKPEIRSPLLEVWGAAAKALQDANAVVFVGYSFPTSDVEMKYFFARALTDNLKLRRIIVIDRRAGELVTKLKSPAAGYGSHFQQAMRPLDVSSWEQLRSHGGVEVQIRDLM